MRLAAVLLVLLLLIGPSLGGGSRDYLQIQEVTMTLKDGNAVFDVKFDLNPLAKLYVLALGSKYIEPDLTNLFGNFDNVTTVKADPSQAVLVAHDAAEYKSGYYLFESRPLKSGVSKFTVVYPDGLSSTTLYNVSSTPSVF
ncbi:MAG: hypothetical protein ACXQT4_01870 [Methanotrichaceae archaeon]